MNNWLIYVILYLVVYTVFTQFYKLSTKTLKSAGALTILLQIIASVVALLMSLAFEFKFPDNLGTYFILGLAIIFYTISDRLNTTVRSGIEASTFSMLNQLSTTFMTIAGIVFLNEEFVFTRFIGAMLIVFSNILIFYKNGKFEWNKYILLGVLSNIAFTVALFLDVNISENFNLGMYVATTLLVPAILIKVFEKIKFSEIKEEWQTGNRKAILTTSIAWALAIICQLTAYQLGNVSIVAPLCAITVILNVIVGYVFLNEKENLLRKIIAAILIIISVILIKM